MYGGVGGQDRVFFTWCEAEGLITPSEGSTDTAGQILNLAIRNITES